MLRITRYTIDLREFQEIKRKICIDQVKNDWIDQNFAFIPRQQRHLTDQINVVVNATPIRVKIKSKLTNLMKITRIEGYNGKYGSNLQGIREISYDLFKFDQIRRWIDDTNCGKRYFMKENFKMIPQSQNHRIWLWFRGEIEDRREGYFPKIEIAK